jgi:integrase
MGNEHSVVAALPKRAKIVLKWTARSIDALNVSVRTDFTDPDCKGLTLRVTPSGKKTWSFLYVRKSDSKKRRVEIGHFPDMHLAAARDKANDFRREVRAKKDPAGQVAMNKRAETVSELLDQFILRHPRPKATWTLNSKRMFARDVKPYIGLIKLPDLERIHVRQVLNVVRDRGATTAVNRTLSALRRAFSWAVSEDIMANNPALNIATGIQELPKDRALSVVEIKAFWNNLDSTSMGLKSRLALKLVLATGQRPGEVCGATKSEVDLVAKKWTIPSARAKNNQLHVVPLSDLALELFESAIELSGDSDFVFSSQPRVGLGLSGPKPMESHALSHAMRRSISQLGLGDIPATPHDLRRTVATHMARMGMSDRVVGRVLNHGTELRRTITARVYIQHDYLPEKKIALEAWASELSSIVNDDTNRSNTVLFLRKD